MMLDWDNPDLRWVWQAWKDTEQTVRWVEFRDRFLHLAAHVHASAVVHGLIKTSLVRAA